MKLFAGEIVMLTQQNCQHIEVTSVFRLETCRNRFGWNWPLFFCLFSGSINVSWLIPAIQLSRIVHWLSLGRYCRNAAGAHLENRQVNFIPQNLTLSDLIVFFANLSWILSVVYRVGRGLQSRFSAKTSECLNSSSNLVKWAKRQFWLHFVVLSILLNFCDIVQVWVDGLYKQLTIMAFPGDQSRMFAFTHKYAHVSHFLHQFCAILSRDWLIFLDVYRIHVEPEHDGWTFYDAEFEFERLGFKKLDKVRISALRNTFCAVIDFARMSCWCLPNCIWLHAGCTDVSSLLGECQLRVVANLSAIIRHPKDDHRWRISCDCQGTSFACC